MVKIAGIRAGTRTARPPSGTAGDGRTDGRPPGRRRPDGRYRMHPGPPGGWALTGAAAGPPGMGAHGCSRGSAGDGRPSAPRRRHRPRRRRRPGTETRRPPPRPRPPTGTRRLLLHPRPPTGTCPRPAAPRGLCRSLLPGRVRSDGRVRGYQWRSLHGDGRRSALRRWAPSASAASAARGPHRGV